jgi:2',3'-cyclic-nucleotide 2'-phosphodiesterase/3'-nucleotidase
LLAAPAPRGATPAGAEATLALLETTDLHANVLSYDYYKLQADPPSAWNARPR